MPNSSLSEMRQRLHELVEAGEIQGAIGEAARHYGFSKLKINDPGPDAFNFSIDVFDIDGNFYAVEDTLCMGAYVVPMYERLAAHDVVSVEKIIELRASHEEGHTGRGAEYSVDEVMNAQRQSGMDVISYEAKVQRESLANSYAFGKCREGRSPEEFSKILAEQIWQCTFYPAYLILESQPGFNKDSLDAVAKDDRELSDMAYNHARHSGYNTLLEHEDLASIVERVVEMDGNYRNKFSSGCCAGERTS